jgi:hypothetical protein
MNQFEIWDYNFPNKGLHPVVLISHPDRCARAKHVNVLFCTSQRQSRPPHEFEVMLDKEGGLNWETFCDCSIMWVVETNSLSNRRGRVTVERRRAIRAMLRDMFLLSAID